LCADVLDIEAKNAGELGEVIDITAGLDHLQHAAAFDRRPLLGIEAIFAAISVFILEESGTDFGAVE
jgi:hypothetical protein